ncbi:MAG TPA: phosphatase PAP2 family protein [Candidatus Paceibacterota bacterium]
MHATDTIIQNYFSLGRTTTLTEFFYLLTILFDFSFHFFVFCICVALLVYLFRGLRHFLIFIISIFSGALIVFLLKHFLEISRPLEGAIEAFGNSFPSGHTTVATIFSICLMYSFDKYFKGVSKFIFNSLCILNIVLVGFSRVYLGVHWVSDIVGGIVLGSVVSYLVILISNHVRKR